MKVVTFFNEKGGVGKTLLTTLFASYMAYEKRERVIVYDMDFPACHLATMRVKDYDVFGENGSAAFRRMVCEAGKAYDIFSAGRNVYGDHDLVEFSKEITQCKSSGEGWILLDFPGQYRICDPVRHLMENNVIDLMVIPADSDSQSRDSLRLITSTMKEPYYVGCRNVMLVWNRETASERNGIIDRYSDEERRLIADGVRIAATRIHDMQTMRRDSSSQCFLRTTLCYPRQFVERFAPYLPTFFEEVVSACGKDKYESYE